MPDLPDVVHHADAVYPRVLGPPGHLTQPRAQHGRPAVPGEIRDVQAHLHLRTPRRRPEGPVPQQYFRRVRQPPEATIQITTVMLRAWLGPSGEAGEDVSPGG